MLYIRAPVGASIAIEAALGRDLEALRTEIAAAKARLALTQGSPEDLSKVVAAHLPTTGVIRPPPLETVVDDFVKVRQPLLYEVLIVNLDSSVHHACRPPVAAVSDAAAAKVAARCAATSGTTYCGWEFAAAGDCAYSVTRSAPPDDLCKRCFGKPSERTAQSDSDLASRRAATPPRHEELWVGTARRALAQVGGAAARGRWG